MLYQEIKIKFGFKYKSNSFVFLFFESLKVVLINVITILTMLANFAAPDLLKMNVF